MKPDNRNEGNEQGRTNGKTQSKIQGSERIKNNPASFCIVTGVKKTEIERGDSARAKEWKL